MPRTRGETRAVRRTDALSRDVVVDAAVALLDEHGERGFTFRLLTERLRTGAGAIYWHVANKDELVSLAADRVLGEALAAVPVSGADAVARLRALAVALYDTLDRHPWAAARVTVTPALPNALRLLDRIGTLITQAGVPAERRFPIATAVCHHLTSVSAHVIAPTVTTDVPSSRAAFLAQTADRWEKLAPGEFPFLAATAADLRDHDDRDQFLAGLDLLLGGLTLEAGRHPAG